MQKTGGAFSHLAEALRIDPSFARAPDRLARALLDLNPWDERAARLLSLAATLGVPERLTVGEVDEARLSLMDQGGLRPDVADWIVAGWLDALPGHRSRLEAWSRLPAVTPMDGTGFSGTAAETPSEPSAVKVAAWPNGSVSVAIITPDGVFVATVEPGQTASPGWRRAATPSAPRSRDVDIAVSGESGMLVWTDSPGIHLRALRRSDPAFAGGLALGETRQVRTERAEKPHYPLAAVATSEADVDVLWTADRHRLSRLVVRSWLATAESTDTTLQLGPDERLRSLQLLAVGARTVWVVSTSDRARLLVSPWSLDVDEFAPWTPVVTPFPAAASVVASIAGQPTVVTASPDGLLVSAALADCVGGRPEWHSVDRPAELTESPPGAPLLAATSAAGSAWLVANSRRGLVLARLGLAAGVVLVKTIRTLPLGPR